MPPSLLRNILTSLPPTLRIFAIRIWMSSGRSWRQYCAEALDFDDARVQAVKRVAMRVVEEEVAQVAVEWFEALEDGGELRLEDADEVGVGKLGEVEQNRFRLLRCRSGGGGA